MPPQVARLAVLFMALVGAFVGARTYFRPATFGDKGHYRAAALVTIASRTPKFAGREECYDCHDDIQKKQVSGFHRALGCEVCHGPQAVHASDPDSGNPRPIEERSLCPRCHAYTASRPTGFPQIELAVHNPLTKCTKCHDAHGPEPPRKPQECSGCHGQIARQKVISRHVDLQCTTCHQGETSAHRLSPRAIRPTKPAERAFCLRCHAEGAPQPAEVPSDHEVPHVSADSHGGRFLCWQCHYPHFPEK